jgi:phenylalanine-4-hydroxylase
MVEIPQHRYISHTVYTSTKWEVVCVPALISDIEFYTLLSQRRFPATCFIRIPEDLDYLEEPDTFHEFFGHLPLLTWQPYAEFLERFALFFLDTDHRYQHFLARIFWFTIEF